MIKSNHLFQLGHQRGTFKRRIKIKEMGWDGIDSTPIRKGRLYEEEWARNSILTLTNTLRHITNSTTKQKRYVFKTFPQHIPTAPSSVKYFFICS